MTKIKGKAFQVRVNGHTIALSTQCSFNTTTQTSESKTKDDPVGPGSDFEFIDWTVSSNSVVGKNDKVTAQMLYAQLLELQLAGEQVEVIVDLVANATGAIPSNDWLSDSSMKDVFTPYCGQAWVDLNMDAPTEGNATLSVTFKAAGPLTKYTATPSNS